MKNVIKNILEGKSIDQICERICKNIFHYGPINTTDMEIASLLSIYHNSHFKKHEENLLLYMGVFYKETQVKSLNGMIFSQYKSFIQERYSEKFTPIQAKISKSITSAKCYSFSAPTSTGKSFVFMQKITESSGDIVIVVPSRALINEYYLKLSKALPDKSINILTFIEKINTNFAKRNIFIVTPERCRELYKYKNHFNVEYFLFDEAQLGNEDSIRGLYFDSVIRRSQKSFPESKFIFAHPFIENPEAQILKNNFSADTSTSNCFIHRNVGQTYMCTDGEWKYYHFGIDKDVMGKTKIQCPFDPIDDIMDRNGSVLFYVSKSRILSGAFLDDFKKYIDRCVEIESEIVDQYIEQIRGITGGETHSRNGRYSRMLALLKKGIVIHHGSIPLQTRIIIEKFTQEGFCKLCFATSTLEQGINMPFDAVFIDRLEASKPLAVKNLIGRAGRSTVENKFDFGLVILGATSQITPFRKIMLNTEILKDVSDLENSSSENPDYEDFKNSILDGSFSDEYNLTPSQLNKLESDNANRIIANILDSTMVGNKPIPLNVIERDISNRLELYAHFSSLYSVFLGRTLAPGEEHVLTTAIKILLWRVYGRSFKNICWYRYSYASRYNQREVLRQGNGNPSLLEANFITGYHDIPNKNLPVFSLFSEGTKAEAVDYDTIVYDTYDFIDKLIGFKLSDAFYAAFKKFFEKNGDERAQILANYIRYGTNDNKHIWLLRYGLTFEDIDSLDSHIENVDETGILFKQSINALPEEIISPIARFMNHKHS